MVKKLSYSQYLLSTPRKKFIYFWARRTISFLIAFGVASVLKNFIGDAGAWVSGIVTFILIYMFISHYLALLIMALEDMLSGGNLGR